MSDETRPHLTRWALLIYRSSRLSCAAKAAIRSFSSRRSRSIATTRVFAANNCFLIAATCVGERIGASVVLSGYSSHRRQAALHQVRCSMLALIDRGGDNSHPAKLGSLRCRRRGRAPMRSSAPAAAGEMARSNLRKNRGPNCDAVWTGSVGCHLRFAQPWLEVSPDDYHARLRWLRSFQPSCRE